MSICAACGAANPDVARFCMACGAALTAPATERRKLATLVFCDVAGSTALGERVDAEAVRELMHRYFGEMRIALERHGGTVEKFIGDAVVAVFGVPQAHEDDALRACRAAVEMQARMRVLNDELKQLFGDTLSIRIGVNSGEVVVGDSEMLVTGDAANVAARLEQAASPGEILLGEATHRLVCDAVTVEAVEPFGAKGKSRPLMAFRLLDVHGLGRGLRRSATPLIGRAHELALLERELQAVAFERRCRLVTIVGEPGVGKSRLVSELIDRIGSQTQPVRGTCLSYGEGITYWPIGEIVRELTGIRDEHTSEDAQALIDALVEGDPDGPAIAARIGQLLGTAEGASTAAETAWAIRRVLAAQTADHPLLVLFDDIQWAEPLLLELISSLPAAIDDAPIFVLCLARPELLERRPDWEASIRLEPLEEAEVDALLRTLLVEASDEQRGRLARASAGNPLFAEELAVWARTRDGEPLTLPTSLNALLNARLDTLDVEARDALERGAIEGELFHRGAVVALSAPASRRTVPAQLEALADKDVVRPAPASFANEAAFRFKHMLVRDAAYQAIAKKIRAALHEQFANWLEQVAGARVTEYDEILGYHLEQSFRYRTELGPCDIAAEAIGARAAELLAVAGGRARDRGDLRAAAALLSRAAELHEPGRLALLQPIAELLFQLGDLAGASDLLDEVIESTRASGDEAVETVATVLRAVIATHGGEASHAHVIALADSAVEVLERTGDDTQLALVHYAAATHHGWLGHGVESTKHYERALESALRAHDLHRARQCLESMIGFRSWGSAPVSEVVAFLNDIPDDLRPLLARSSLPHMHACLMASYSGRFDVARDEYARAQLLAREVGSGLQESMSHFAGVAELLAGDPAAAERVLREGYDRLGELGAEAFRSTSATLLADALLRQGREEEVEELLDVADRIAPPDDIDPQVRSRALRARVLAGRGKLAEAERLAREAVDIVSRTDATVLHGDALLALAEVLRVAGADAESKAALRQALELYEHKENVVQAEQTRQMLATG